MILVYVERESDGSGDVAETSREAVTLARSLSAAGGGIAIDAVVVGAVDPAFSGTLAAYGVRDVYQADGDPFSTYSAAAHAAAVQAARAATSAVVVLAGGGPQETEVLAHVATREGVAMAANVVSFGGLAPFVVTRQVVGGQVMEEMQLDERPAVFTVAGHAVEAAPAATAGPGTLKPLAVEVTDADLVARVLRTSPREVGETGDLKKARVVVGAGRGAGGPDGFAHVDELASLLGGTVGVSRVVTSLGWRPHHEQVGQTGTRISPEVYIPCGISGAIQHWAGCSSSKVILAINTDAEAPMVTKATYAVVGDMHEVVPAINEALKA